MKTFLMTLLLAGLAGCAAQVQGAAHLGSEATTWVFVRTDSSSTTGVYHCNATGGAPVCRKADIKE